MTHFMVTGANGFVGGALCERLRHQGHAVTKIQRAATAGDGTGADCLPAGDDFSELAAHWPPARPCDVAIHLAARVHVMNEPGQDALARYRRTNVQGSLRVAEVALRAGATRFVFVSSVKALGDVEPGTPPHPWRISDTPTPADPYGISKLEAERALASLCHGTAMSLVVVRPPLVYGPHVRANFLRLMAAVAKRRPLPLASVHACRSMIHIDNLVDALLTCATHAGAAGEIFHVSDGEDLPVAAIVRVLGSEMARPARLLRVPPVLLETAAALLGRQEQASRLLRPLRLDIAHIRDRLGWEPPVSAENGLRATAAWYRDRFLSSRQG
ncbi:MAG: NAD-dependent epimerase/dehydratase family protein [Janthinobacterium lividum]